MNDIFLAIALVGLVSAFSLFVSRIFRVPFLPFLVTGGVLILVGLLTHIPSSPLFLVSPDGEAYRQWGLDLSRNWRGETLFEERQIWPGKGVWAVILGIFYFVAGPVVISPVVFNALTVALSVVFLQKATELFFRVKPRLIFVALTLSSAPVLLNGPTLLREAIFWLGVSIGVAAITYFYVGRYIPGLGMLLASMVLILGIRPNYGVVLVYLLAFSSIVLSVHDRYKKITRLMVTLAAGSLLALSFPAVYSYLTNDPRSIPEQVEITANALADETVTTALSPTPKSGDSSSVESSSGSPLASSLARLPYLVVGPLWWELGPEPIWLVVIASTLHYWFLLSTSAILVIRRGKPRVFPVFLFILSGVVLASLSPVLTNYGIIIRFRVIAEIVLTPLCAGFLASYRQLGKREET